MATTLVETLVPGSAADPHAAMNQLVRAGAQFVEAALADNPNGPVSMTTTIDRTETTYEVHIGFDDDRSRGRTIWHRTVYFGSTDRHCAGGGAFVEAARLQEAVAWAALTLLENRR